MRRAINFISFFALFLLSQAVALAEEATTDPIVITQPDGSQIVTYIYGDEYLHYRTTDDGYTILRDTTGYYVYAISDGSNLLSTDRIARSKAERTDDDIAFLNSIEKHLKPAPSNLQPVEPIAIPLNNTSKRSDLGAASTRLATASTFDVSNLRGLVILVNYNDVTFSRSDILDVYTGMVSTSDYPGLPDEDDPTTIDTEYAGSVVDYFRDNSYGKFTPEFDVIGPVTIDYAATDAQGTSNGATLMKAACIAADELADFSKYDSDGDGIVDFVFGIFAGYGSSDGADENLLWSHASGISGLTLDGVRLSRYACDVELNGTEGTQLRGIGTICHEFSHVLGLADLYDVDSSDGTSVTPQYWSIMARGNRLNDRRTPCSYSLYERYAMGFASIKDQDGNGEITVIDAAGTYSLNDLKDSNAGYMIKSSVENEFFLIENRQQKGWDAYLKGKGMLIWRVDSTSIMAWESNQVNANDDHNYLVLLRANPNTSSSGTVTDGDGDPFPGSGNITSITNSTDPSLCSWTGINTPFEITNISEDDEGVISFTVSEASVTGTNITNINGTGTADDPYTISSATEWNTLAQYIADNADDLTGRYVKLANDISFSSTTIEPFGNDFVTYFNGTFDGNGKTISDIALTTSKSYTGGCFTKTGENAYIHNFSVSGTISGAYSYCGGVVGALYGKIDNVTSNVNVTYSGSVGYIGGLVGYSYGGVITNCSNCATIDIQKTSPNTGGIVGYSYYGIISGCTNSGDVSGYSYTGGIAGQTYYYTNIQNCSNTGTVNGSSYYTGGIAGYSRNYCKIYSCTNSATVTSSSYNAGGIVGRLYYSTISGCTNSEAASITGLYHVGGIAGYLAGSATITNSYNYAAISTTNDDTDSEELYACSGGIIGYGSSDEYIYNCLNAGEVSGILRYIGGIAGYINSSQINSCSNTGAVTGGGYYYVGGIVAYLNGNDIVTGCTNSGAVSDGSSSYIGGIVGYGDGYETISDCSNSASVTGGSQIGGIAGRIFVPYDDDDAASYISDCLNSGPVTGSGFTIGGIVGVASSAIISGCSNSGEISSTYSSSSYETRVGGIVGQIQTSYSGNTYSNIYGTIDGCTNTGDVSASASTGTAVGGIAGDAYKYITISNCDNHGDITCGAAKAGGIVGALYNGQHTIELSYNSGDISADQYAGGVVGYCGYSTDAVSNCFNVGDITATSSHAGGIHGCMAGSLKNSYSGGTITSGWYAGGLIGRNYNTSYAVTINDCYFFGKVECDNVAGCIIGCSTDSISSLTDDYVWHSNSTIENVYYLAPNAPGNSVTNTITFSDSDQSANYAALRYDELAELNLNDYSFSDCDVAGTVWTSMDNLSYPMLTNVCENDFALAYSAAIIPTNIGNTNPEDDDTYDNITTTVYLGGTDSDYDVSWTSDNNIVFSEWDDKTMSSTDENNNQSAWEGKYTGYVAISGNKAEFAPADNVTVVFTATSDLYANANADEEATVSTAASIRSKHTAYATEGVSVNTTLVLNISDFTSGIEKITADDLSQDNCELVSQEYYTLSGTRVAEPTAGQEKSIYIVVRKYSNGTVAATKEVK